MIRAEQLAGEILRSTVTSLLLNLRFLESALFRLHPQPEQITFATDGQNLYYGYSFLFNLYRQDAAELTRGYLHTLLHCIFRHPFIGKTVNRELWDLAADIAVEAAIEDMNLRSMQTVRGKEAAAQLGKLRQHGLKLTAEKLYHSFATDPSARRLALGMARDFHFCDHTPWYEHDHSKKQDNEEDGSGQQNPMQDDSPAAGSNGASQLSPDSTPPDPDAQSSGGGQQPADGSTPQSRRAALSAQWEDISRHVQMALETLNKQMGTQPGHMMQELRALNREHYDYRSFLQRFATLHEVMKINDDEFDYIFYTYGLKLYGNVPLVEPLEYKEARRIREFAIVIDTSGSTAGDLVQTFLQKTYNILKSTETFASRIRLRVIQCDAAVQESVLLRSQDEFEEYIRTFKIRGQGGTDFRPAFAHVNELVQSGELSKLKGLIYFTDGYGTYPEKKPDYEAAFVFVRENDYDEPPRVPPWAIKLVLDRDEIAAI